jgi:hypothetical protein
METPILFDRETYIEVVIGRAALCHPGFIQLVADAFAAFGCKPLLLVCEGPAESIKLMQAYDNGLKLASITRARIAIVLGGREPTDADRLTDLAATNRGAPVRSFRDLPEAKAWLSAD